LRSELEEMWLSNTCARLLADLAVVAHEGDTMPRVDRATAEIARADPHCPLEGCCLVAEDEAWLARAMRRS